MTLHEEIKIVTMVQNCLKRFIKYVYVIKILTQYINVCLAIANIKIKYIHTQLCPIWLFIAIFSQNYFFGKEKLQTL